MSQCSGMSGAGVTVGSSIAEGWWLVLDPEEAWIDEEDGGLPVVVAGPFENRAEAHWAALAQGLDGDGWVEAVYGVCREDGMLVRRPSPQERAWLAHLSEQLDRLGEDWDEVLSDTDPLTTLVVELTAALAEAGLPLHDCSGRAGSGTAGQTGGVCLTPDTVHGGVVVSWRQHDRMSVEQVRGAAADAAVQQAMNRAVAEVLAACGYPVEPFAGGTGHLVRADVPLG